MNGIKLLEHMLGQAFAPLQQREVDRAAADPVANKLTRLAAPGKDWSYRYVPAGKDGLGRTVRFCWSCHRNAAGYFLTWREVRGKTNGKRDQYAARRVRRRCMEMAMRRATVFRERRAV